jgi:hypothetical protein
MYPLEIWEATAFHRRDQIEPATSTSHSVQLIETAQIEFEGCRSHRRELSQQVTQLFDLASVRNSIVVVVAYLDAQPLYVGIFRAFVARSSYDWTRRVGHYRGARVEFGKWRPNDLRFNEVGERPYECIKAEG